MLNDFFEAWNNLWKTATEPINKFIERLFNKMIKDSGNRTEFTSGAVRDVQEGKGSCYLMPFDVIDGLYKITLDNDEVVFECIYKFTRTADIEHLYSALNDVVYRQEMFECYSDMLLEVSIHFEEGAKKYGERNWEKGIPTQRYIDSAVRHYLKWLRGDDDERHDRSFCWNIICCIWTCIHYPELNEYAKN